jgi:16S rRNA C967 or C1407 C5-methylase (RsmB/RsmF family)/NOL1/NOP2/fmu family ribosome biogenesis protein
MLPTDFIQNITARFGTDAPAFLAALEQPAPISLRLHPHKSTDFDTKHAFSGIIEGVIPWYQYGRYLSQRPGFALDPLWHGGAYYVQEASSMVVAEVVRQALGADITAPITALDFCAAPGGKSTLLLDVLAPKAVVVANEVIRPRVAALAENIERWGYSNVAITSAEVEQFGPLAGQFDLILVDAPCSGEGMFRKDPHAASEWSLDHVALCAARQQRILKGLVPLLAPSGVLIYSTCTFNEAENDQNIAWLIEHHGLELVPISLDQDFGFTPTKLGHAAWPHRVKGEGFYIAALRQQGERDLNAYSAKLPEMKRLQKPDKQALALASNWLRDPDRFEIRATKNGMLRYFPQQKPIFHLLEQHISYCLIGQELGEVKGKDVIPTHALALALDLVHPAVVDVDETAALAFLRKQDITLDGTPTGWTCIRYAGVPLGWVKVLPNRVNNYLPMERRLRNQG